jgi:hypothetical protein
METKPGITMIALLAFCLTQFIIKIFPNQELV